MIDNGIDCLNKPEIFSHLSIMANTSDKFLLIDFRFLKAKLASLRTCSSVRFDNLCFNLDGEKRRPRRGVSGHLERKPKLFSAFDKRKITERAKKL